VKINMYQFGEYLGGLSHDDPAVRQKSVGGLAKYSSAEWQGTPDAIPAAVAALLSASRLRAAAPPDGAFWAEAAKVLGVRPSNAGFGRKSSLCEIAGRWRPSLSDVPSCPRYPSLC
jgi:hypothetical protein